MFYEQAKRSYELLDAERRKRFFPKCPVATGKAETNDDRIFLAIEEARLQADRIHLKSDGFLALQKARNAHEKKRKAQLFFSAKKREREIKRLGRLPFCELIDNKYVFHPLEIPKHAPVGTLQKSRRFMSMEEFDEEKRNRGEKEWWTSESIPWTQEEMEQEWQGPSGGLDD